MPLCKESASGGKSDLLSALSKSQCRELKDLLLSEWDLFDTPSDAISAISDLIDLIDLEDYLDIEDTLNPEQDFGKSQTFFPSSTSSYAHIFLKQVMAEIKDLDI